MSVAEVVRSLREFAPNSSKREIFAVTHQDQVPGEWMETIAGWGQ
jgi:hypothetical protein